MSTGIHHFRVENSTSIREFLLTRDFSPDKVDYWLDHGCVYLDGVRHRSDVPASPSQIVRLHTEPKQYRWLPGALLDRVAFDHEDFLVIDKPSGLPVHATLDNYLQNAKFIIEQELKAKVYSTHRLDIPTSGLLIFAKNPKAQTAINKLFAERRVKKAYRAITATPVSLQEHVLYLNPETRAPRDFSFEARAGWWECRLEVEGTTEIDCGFEHAINLITGKTHQIRAQLSALGAPILGDTLYRSTKHFDEFGIALSCHALQFTYRNQNFNITRQKKAEPG